MLWPNISVHYSNWMQLFNCIKYFN